MLLMNSCKSLTKDFDSFKNSSLKFIKKAMPTFAFSCLNLIFLNNIFHTISEVIPLETVFKF